MAKLQYERQKLRVSHHNEISVERGLEMYQSLGIAVLFQIGFLISLNCNSTKSVSVRGYLNYIGVLSLKLVNSLVTVKYVLFCCCSSQLETFQQIYTTC